MSEEKYFTNTFSVTQKPTKPQHRQNPWTEPPNPWNEPELPMGDPEMNARDGGNLPDFNNMDDKKDDKPTNLQALVDAIGTRMRDIENVVQKMSDNVQKGKPGPASEYISAEKRQITDADIQLPRKHRKGKEEKEHNFMRTKRPNPDGEHYKSSGSKYLHSTTDVTTEQPLFIEDNHVNGYFSDASNSVLRRVNPPKEPTYMAPVENRRKASHVSDMSEEAEKKHKKHAHKKKRNKNRGHKKHHRQEKKKRINKPNSIEVDKNVVSLEDSSAVASA